MTHLLLPLLLVFSAGVGLGPGTAWRLNGIFFALAFLLGMRTRHHPFLVLAIGCFLLGIWRGSGLPVRPGRGDFPSYPATVHGRVGLPQVRLPSLPLWRFTLATHAGSIEVTTGFCPRIGEGDHLCLTGTFVPFSYGDTDAGYRQFRQDRARGQLGRLKLKAPNQLTRMKRAGLGLGQLRTEIRRLLTLFPEDLRGLMTGLLLGDRRLLARDHKEQFRNAGTAHLLAISGLHVGLLAYVLYHLGIRCMGAMRHGFRVALLVGAIGALLYALLSGFSPSSARASLAVWLVTLALVSGRRPEPVSILASVIFLLLLFSPELLWSISLQLSASAVLGILRFGVPPPQPRLVRRLARASQLRRLLDRFVLLPARVSAAATLGTLPVTLYHFGTFHSWVVLANLLACPLLAVTLVFAASALAVSVISFYVAQLIAFPATVALRMIVAINAWFAQTPGHTLHLPPIHAHLAIGCFCLLFVPWRGPLRRCCQYLLQAYRAPRYRRAKGRAKSTGVPSWWRILGALGLLTLAYFLPPEPAVPQGGIVLDLTRGTAMLYRSQGTLLLFTSGVRGWELSRKLRALYVREVDVSVSLDGAVNLPVKAHHRCDSVSYGPAKTLQLRSDLALRILPGGRQSSCIEVTHGRARFLFGVPSLALSAPLVIGKLTPEDAIACEATWVVLTGNPRSGWQTWRPPADLHVFATESVGTVRFVCDRRGSWQVGSAR